jgi:hypothetical protein
MKDDHLTLRLPHELAQALARWADSHGLPKSHVVREAVAQYVATPSEGAVMPSKVVTAAELAARWSALPRLEPDEARAFEADVAAGRKRLPPVRDPWA